MNQMEIFKNPEFGAIRIVVDGEKYFFCGMDVARALGYKDTVNALKAHCKEDGVAFYHLTDSLGREQKAKFISEGNLYRLIVHSKLPSAERFERWVFDEVLPSIRQHGAYLTREKLWEVATSPEALLKLCSDLLAEREKNAALQADNARLQGKAVYYDLFIDLRHSTNLRTTAKELDVPERRFVRFLLERRYVYRTPSGCVLPYAKGSNEGLFCVKDFCRNGHTGSYTLVTPKGKLHFAELRSLILVTV
ncbi:MAG: phage antirepressor [Gemmiger sp.]|nr:phage antirepressor [Gemmiger sp.]MDY5784369.1 phage antirepressor [Gemmiger sp.]